MLNHCDLRDMIARDQWFGRTLNFHSHHQQSVDKWDEQTFESDADVSVFSTKKSGWGGLQISFHGSRQVTKEWSDLREIIIMDSGTTVNIFGNIRMITKRQKEKVPMNFLTNAGSKIVDEVGEIPGSGQNKFHPEMIANILSLNERTKNTR